MTFINESHSFKIRDVFILSGLICACISCQDRAHERSTPPASYESNKNLGVVKPEFIYASTWVLQFLTQSLVERRAQVQLIAPIDADPALHTPDAETLINMQSAKLIVLNGAQLEEGLKSVGLPISRTIKSADHFRAQWLTYPKALSAQHQHGPEGAHSHRGVDGHTWLDPLLLIEQLKVIQKRLERAGVKTSPEALNQLEGRLRSLDRRWRELTPHLRRATLISNHPAYQYIARRYQLKIIPLDLSPDEPLSDEQRAQLAKALEQADAQARRSGIYLLWESAPSASVKRALSGFSLTHVTLHTLEQPVGHLDPLSRYLSDLDALERAVTALSSSELKRVKE